MKPKNSQSTTSTLTKSTSMIHNPIPIKQKSPLVPTILCKKYLPLFQNSYQINQINQLINHKKNHYVCLFKEYLIYDDLNEFLNKFYPLNTINKYIPFYFNKISTNKSLQMKSQLPFLFKFSSLKISKIMMKNYNLKKDYLTRTEEINNSKEKNNTKFDLIFTKGEITESKNISINTDKNTFIIDNVDDGNNNDTKTTIDLNIVKNYDYKMIDNQVDYNDNLKDLYDLYNALKKIGDKKDDCNKIKKINILTHLKNKNKNKTKKSKQNLHIVTGSNNIINNTKLSSYNTFYSKNNTENINFNFNVTETINSTTENNEHNINYNNETQKHMNKIYSTTIRKRNNAHVFSDNNVILIRKDKNDSSRKKLIFRNERLPFLNSLLQYGCRATIDDTNSNNPCKKSNLTANINNATLNNNHNKNQIINSNSNIKNNTINCSKNSKLLCANNNKGKDPPKSYKDIKRSITLYRKSLNCQTSNSKNIDEKINDIVNEVKKEKMNTLTNFNINSKYNSSNIKKKISQQIKNNTAKTEFKIEKNEHYKAKTDIFKNSIKSTASNKNNNLNNMKNNNNYQLNKKLIGKNKSRLDLNISNIQVTSSSTPMKNQLEKNIKSSLLLATTSNDINNNTNNINNVLSINSIFNKNNSLNNTNKNCNTVSSAIVKHNPKIRNYNHNCHTLCLDRSCCSKGKKVNKSFIFNYNNNLNYNKIRKKNKTNLNDFGNEYFLNVFSSNEISPVNNNKEKEKSPDESGKNKSKIFNNLNKEFMKISGNKPIIKKYNFGIGKKECLKFLSNKKVEFINRSSPNKKNLDNCNDINKTLFNYNKSNSNKRHVKDIECVKSLDYVHK